MKTSSGWLSRKRRREAAYQRGYEAGLAAATASSDPVAYLRHGEQTFVQNVPFGAMWISDKDDPRSFPVYDRPQRSATSIAVTALAEAYQKYLDAVQLYNERHAIMKTKALGTMRVDEEYKALDEARRAFDKLAIYVATSALSAQVQDKQDGNRPIPYDRDTLGRFVREVWVQWALSQPEPKPSWLLPYDQLSEADREADRQIGEAVARWVLIGEAARNEPMQVMARSPAIKAIAAERARQIEKEGWSPEHDDKYTNCELLEAAACYALHNGGELDDAPGAWPWPHDCWKPTSRQRDLEKAGALIAAELDRVIRAVASAKAGGRADGC